MDDSGPNFISKGHARPSQLHQVNGEIEVNIHKTREIESEIVKCSEIENGFATRESDLRKTICIQEFELNGLIQVAAIAKTSVELLEKELNCSRIKLDEVHERMNNKREAFIILCEDFQGDIVKGESEELWTLLSEKDILENEIYILNMNINALRNSVSAFIDDTLEDLHSSNSGTVES